MGRLQSALTSLASQGLFASNSTPSAPNESPAPDATNLPNGTAKVAPEAVDLEACSSTISQPGTDSDPVAHHDIAASSNEVQLAANQFESDPGDESIDVIMPETSVASLDEVASEDVASEDGASEDVALEEVASEDVVSEEVDSEDVVSEDVVSEDVVSEDVTSEDTFDDDNTYAGTTPNEDDSSLEAEDEVSSLQSSTSEMQGLLSLLGISTEYHVDDASENEDSGTTVDRRQSADSDEVQVLPGTSATLEFEVEIPEADTAVPARVDESDHAIDSSNSSSDPELDDQHPDVTDEHPLASDQSVMETTSETATETTSTIQSMTTEAPSDPAHDEDDNADVMQLVEQVLGISPEIRIEEEVAADVLDTDENTESSAEAKPQWAQGEAGEPEAVAVEESSAAAEATPDDSTNAMNDAYNPVMETWLTVDRDAAPDETAPNDAAPNEAASHEISAEASPPLRTGASEPLRGTNVFPQSSPDTTHWPEATVNSNVTVEPDSTNPSASGLSSIPSNMPSPDPMGPTEDTLSDSSSDSSVEEGTYAGDDVTYEAGDDVTYEAADDDTADSAPAASDLADAADESSLETLHEVVGKEIGTEVETPVGQADALSQISGVKAKPTNYEVSLAQRLLHSDFGKQIQELDAELTKQVEGSGPHVVLLVSLEPNAQQAEVATGLGMTVCVQRSGPTMLVDADLEVRSITRAFEANGGGLLDAIIGADDYVDFVKPTSCEQLKLLPTGNDFATVDTTDATQIAQRITDHVEEWKRRFDLILIDAGTATSWMAKQLAPHADATFVCVKLGHSQRERLIEVTQQLTNDGASVKGCITTSDAR